MIKARWRASDWTFQDGGQSANYTPLHTFNIPGENTIALTITTVNGCIEQASASVNVIPSPIANFYFSPDNPKKENEVQFINLTNDAVTFQWDLGNGVHSVEENPVNIYQTPGIYSITLVVHNAFCSDSLVKSIFVSDEVIFYVPNVFTPDGRGGNNVFQPVFTSGFDPYNFHMTIYNRYGEIVFESYDATKSWDGNY